MIGSWTNHVLWIGGGSCQGKSTVADVLGDSTGFRVVHLNNWLFELLDTSDERSSSAMNWFRTTEIEKRFAEGGDPQIDRYLESLMEQTTGSRPLLAHIVDSPTIIEGNCFLPAQAGDLSPQGRCIWLLSTDEFRETRYEERVFRQGVLDLHDHPETAWRNWINRDHQQAAYVRKPAAELDLDMVVVDASDDVQSVARTLAARFGLDAR